MKNKKPLKRRPVRRSLGEGRRRAVPEVAVRRRRDSKKQFLIRATTGLMLILFFVALLFLLPPFALSAFFGAVLLTVFFVEWPQLFPFDTPFDRLRATQDKPIKSFLTYLPNKKGLLLFLVYPTVPFICAVLLNHDLDYRKLLFFVALLVSLFDFGSYAFGSLFGKHKIAPSISPRKSWEGALGGYLVVTITLFFLIKQASLSFFGLAFLSAIICALALSGDLFESFLKRKAGVKDSGNILPGHGGFMDRFDAMLFVVPFFYLFKEFLGHLFGLV